MERSLTAVLAGTFTLRFSTGLTGAMLAAYLARLASGGTRVVPVVGEPDFEFDRGRIIDVVRKAAGPSGPSH